MREWKRIFINPIWISAFILLIGINIISFFIQQKEQIATTLEQKNSYIAEYDSWLNEISKKAELMQKVSVFNDPSSFEFRNIMKTAQDYGRMKGQRLHACNNDLITSWFKDGYNQLTGFIMIIVTVMILIEDRHNKMCVIIGTTKDGRLKLTFWRVGALIAAAVFCTILFSILRIVLSCIYYGEIPDTRVLIQSVELYQYISLPMNIAQFIYMNILIQILANIFWGFLIWFLFCLPIIRINILMIGVMLSLEYFFGSFLTSHKTFMRYTNINVLGYPINERSFIIIVLSVFILGLIVLVLYQQSRSNYQRFHQYGTDKKEIRISWKNQKLVRMEVYKLGVINYGFLILILFASFYLFTIELPIMSLENSELLEIQYYKIYNGAVPEQIEAVLEEERLKCQLEYEILISQVQEGQLLSEHEIQSRKDRLTAIENIIQKNQLLIKEGNANTRLIGTYAYENVFGDQGSVYRMKIFLAITFLMILIIVPIMNYENQRNMNKILSTFQNGRSELFQKKLILAGCFCMIIWIFMTIKEWFDIQNIWGVLPGLTADAFSLTGWEPRIHEGPIWSYLLILYFTRLLGLLCGGMVIFAISTKGDTYVKSVLLSTLILLLPTIAKFVFGTIGRIQLSYVDGLSQVDLYPDLFKIIAFAIIGGASGCFTYIQWKKV